MLTKHAAHRKDLSGKPATFTHQHFRKVAEIIRHLHDTHQYAQPLTNGNVQSVVVRFADALEVTNPKFDRHRFLMACQAEA